VSESLNVDLAPDRTICGIKLLNANEQLGGPEADKSFEFGGSGHIY
jgi:hypothetical protein